MAFTDLTMNECTVFCLCELTELSFCLRAPGGLQNNVVFVSVSSVLGQVVVIGSTGFRKVE